MTEQCPGSRYQLFRSPIRPGITYAHCPRCLRLYAVNRDGTIRIHRKVNP